MNRKGGFSPAGIRLVELFQITDHHVDELGEGRAAHFPCVDQPSIPQNRHDVADLEDLLQIVRDIEDPLPVFLKLSDHFKQLLPLGVIEGGGGLVNQEELAIGGKRFRYGNDLLVGDVELLDRKPQVDLHSHSLDELHRGAAHPSFIEEPRSETNFVAEKDILDSAQGRHQIPALVDSGNSVATGFARGAYVSRFPIELNLALVRPDRRRRGYGPGYFSLRRSRQPGNALCLLPWRNRLP